MTASPAVVEPSARAGLPVGVEPSRLSARDVAREVALDLRARPGRSALTALGTLIGIAVLVCTVGLAASLDAQIAARFDALSATEVSVSTVQIGRVTDSYVPVDAPAKALRVGGSVAAANLSKVEPMDSVTGTPIHDPRAPVDAKLTVYAATSGLADVVHAKLTGAFFSDWHDATAQPVAVLGRGAADRLSVSDPSAQPVVFLNQRPVVVIGIIEDVARRTELMQAVIVPQGYALASLGLTAPTDLVVETKPGAAQVVGDQLGLAVRPDAPDMLSVKVPPSPEVTRAQIAGDTRALFLVLGVISLLIGGVGIANMTLVAVLERTAEIGLRRAIGATRRHIVTQFLASSLVTGVIGAIGGVCLGMIVTTLVALVAGWPPTMPIALPAAAPALGGLIGLLAGAYPAHRASRIEPIEALRAG